MLPVLAVSWFPLLFRGTISVLFGILMLLWSGITTAALVLLYGIYATIDGILALFVAFRALGSSGFGSLLFEGLVRIGAGVIAFVYPGLSETALLTLFATWVLLSGIAAIVVALVLRRELSGEWPLPLAGTLSIVFGVLLMRFSSASVLPLTLGLYAIIFGLTLMALALRLRQLADEIPATVVSPL